MTLGPTQVLVVGFAEPEFSGEVLEEFSRLEDSGIVRLIDAVPPGPADRGELAVGQPRHLGSVQPGEHRPSRRIQHARARIVRTREREREGRGRAVAVVLPASRHVHHGPGILGPRGAQHAGQR